jgi:hypothetical protein
MSLPIKAFWYRSASAGFWPTLADPDPAIRQVELDNMTSAFALFAGQMHANTIVVMLPDNDGYQAGYGGGFPYNPNKYPAPLLAAAQELVVATAAAAGLKVLFEIALSAYHVMVDDTFGNPTGAFDFIHCCIDPGGFYPGIGKSYFGDPRVAGFSLGGEWVRASGDAKIMARHGYMLAKYFPFVNTLAKWKGASGKAYTYALAGPDVDAGGVAQARIDALAASCPGMDYIGFEAYENDAEVTTGVATDLETLFASLPGPASQYLICESGANEPDSSGKHWFPADVIRVAAAKGAAGVCLWQADGVTNKPGGVTLVDQEVFAFCDAVVTPVLTKTYPAPPDGWHWEAHSEQYPDYTDPRRYGFGDVNQAVQVCKIDLTPNAMGRAAAVAFENS